MNLRIKSIFGILIKSTLLSISLLVIGMVSGIAQEKVVYKQIDTLELTLEIYRPSVQVGTEPLPSMVFFFGGGWTNGSTAQFRPHAEYFSSRGLVCILVDYRVSSRHQTTPFEALMDAKSAMRFIRKNAGILKIDPEKIIGAGGSAGGHLAAGTALISSFDDPTDDLSISCKPNALVLFNPVIDNGPGGYGFERIGSKYKEFSPLHNIESGAPPTIIFLGTKDNLIPVETMSYYQTVMKRVGSTCELHLYEDQIHGFFNYNNYEYFQKTIHQADTFLQSIGFLGSSPN